MARRTGPKHRMCRRTATPLCGQSDCPSNDRSYPPGMMGRKRFRLSDYGLHLREKQKVKYHYGIMEKQLRRYFDEARKQEGNTGINLLIRLERRLDNVVFRLGFGSTRPQGRQFINHEHILVNGEKASIPSIELSPGDVVTPRTKETSERLVQEAVEGSDPEMVPGWLDRDDDQLEGTVVELPEREEIPGIFDELMVVEFLS